MWRIRSAAVLILLFIVASTASADFVPYTFSGVNGLAGSFALDASTPFAITVDPISGTYAELRSPLNSISGAFGEYTFQGSSYLTILNLPPTFLLAQDFWIVRSDITGPLINGRAPVKLNLFMYHSAAYSMPISLIPPPPSPNEFDFQYTVIFSDETSESGRLYTLQMVTEPSTFILLAIALVALSCLKRFI